MLSSVLNSNCMTVAPDLKRFFHPIFFQTGGYSLFEQLRFEQLRVQTFYLFQRRDFIIYTKVFFSIIVTLYLEKERIYCLYLHFLI